MYRLIMPVRSHYIYKYHLCRVRAREVETRIKWCCESAAPKLRHAERWLVSSRLPYAVLFVAGLSPSYTTDAVRDRRNIPS
jgi:hypothetical protein